MITKKLQKYIIGRSEEFKVFLGFNEFALELEFKEKYENNVAATKTDYKYPTITITFYNKITEKVEKYGMEYLDKTIMHELCHTFTYKFSNILKRKLNKDSYEAVDEFDEQMVERMSVKFYNLWRQYTKN
jgi:predicted SprT family Zn-dependent metalloprotease